MSYVVEFPQLQMNANDFQHFLYGLSGRIDMLKNISRILPNCKWMHKFSGTFCSGFMLSYPVQDWENELYSKNSPTANERQHFHALFVGVLYGGI